MKAPYRSGKPWINVSTHRWQPLGEGEYIRQRGMTATTYQDLYGWGTQATVWRDGEGRARYLRTWANGRTFRYISEGRV